MNSINTGFFSQIKKEIPPFSSFLDSLKNIIQNIFHNQETHDQLSLYREVPESTLRKVMSMNPLSVSIPLEYGGRGCVMKENLALLSMASYESLPLSLTLGINT